MRETLRFVRLMWLAVVMLIDEPALYADYRRRFRVCIYDFRLDRRVVRRAGLWFQAIVFLDYRLMWYLERSGLE